MGTIRGEFVVINGSEKDKSALAEIKIDYLEVYEVIRVMEGIPLFFEDHLERFKNSCNKTAHPMPDSVPSLDRQIVSLAQKNGYKEGNVMIRFVFGQEKTSQIVQFVHHSYPAADDYKNGVAVDLLYKERPNPEAKVVNQPLREEANRMISSQKLYEVLLVDKHGYITEGSRSNVCFLKDGTLITAPADKVLKGITWLKTIDICDKKGIPVIYKDYSPADISGFDAAFITGTSPKLLPIASVGNVNFDTQNTLMRMLMNEYDGWVARYLRQAGVCL